MSRLDDLRRFYSLLSMLESRLGGKRCLSDCDAKMKWPRRGVYFFFEPGEHCTDSGNGLRIVRVGTHALVAKSKSTLWGRLSQHRGTAKMAGGNHRGSIFRLLVGEAHKPKVEEQYPTSWGIAGDPGKAAMILGSTRRKVRAEERDMEAVVSRYIGAMPFLWLAIEDAPGPDSKRGLIERNSIALLSNWQKTPLDPASASWLGSFSLRERVRGSGLWNNNHIEESYYPGFLDVLESLIKKV